MKIARFEKDQLVTYSFSSLEDLNDKIEQWQKEFREKNKTEKVIKLFGRDKTYEKYCEELDDLINQYTEG